MLAILAQTTCTGDSKELGCLLKLQEGKSVGQFFPTLSSFINLLVPLVFVLAGIVLFLLLIGGGFSIIASGGNAKNVEQGKNQITGAIIGFLVIFASYWIIQIIQTITGISILGTT